MPLFEYQCPACGEKQEVLVRTVEVVAAPTCSRCGAGMYRSWAPVAGHTRGAAKSCAPSGGRFS